MATERVWVKGEEHLGGYWPGGDPSGWYPDLWEWLVLTLNVRSVIDVGCGEGHALEYFRELGCWADGVDGIVGENKHVQRHDFNDGPYDPGRRYDLAWSCEFVEHVEEEYVENFIETFRWADLLVMTHALPGQRGHHHVNCRPARYWKGLLGRAGFEYVPGLTLTARDLAAVNEMPDNYFKKTGLVFRRLT